MCAECAELLAAAQTATINHIRLLSKLQLAKLTRNHDEVATLTALLPEAFAARHESTLRYREHCDRHLTDSQALSSCIH
jgi:hypothetical protein